jgi:hypothetical protein
MEAAHVMLVNRLGTAAAARGEELLAEIPATLRRLGTLMLVLAISVPAFLVGCLAVLAWWLIG